MGRIVNVKRVRAVVIDGTLPYFSSFCPSDTQYLVCQNDNIYIGFPLAAAMIGRARYPS